MCRGGAGGGEESVLQRAFCAHFESLCMIQIEEKNTACVFPAVM